MISVETEPWFLDVCEKFDAICAKLDAEVDKLQERGVTEKNMELERKLAVEIKLKKELSEQFAKVSDRHEQMEKVCTSLKSQLKITDNDQIKLDNVRETFKVAREFTGIRFYYDAPPNKCTGFIKNKTRRLLLPFEMEPNSDALWDLMMITANPDLLDKENHAPNLI